jgi:endonuclease-8
MPEGDTIHKIAAFLRTTLTGRALVGLTLRGRPLDCPPAIRVIGVTSKGKHLFIDLERETRIRVHLGMYGSWHHYPVGRPWAKPQRSATLVLRLQDVVYVCFNAKEVELLERSGIRARDRETFLGPDLTGEPPCPEILHTRALRLLTADTPVTDMLLDQRIASGIGNVYKSEVLFLEHCAPSTRFAELSEETFARLYQTAARLLAMNLGGGPRTTRTVLDNRSILWVYGRSGCPCLCCGARIERAPLGRHLRSTYWCPACQPSPLVGTNGSDCAW